MTRVRGVDLPPISPTSVGATAKTPTRQPARVALPSLPTSTVQHDDRQDASVLTPSAIMSPHPPLSRGPEQALGDGRSPATLSSPSPGILLRRQRQKKLAKAAPTSPCPVPGVVVGRELGSGNHGKVHDGHTPGGTRVAVKTASAMYRHTVEREHAILDLARPHPHVIARHVPTVRGGTIIMEHLASTPMRELRDVSAARVLSFEGDAVESLEAAASAGPMFDSREAGARWFIAQAALGLRHLHRAGIGHRDIKPDNMLVDPITKRLCLCDFGVSATSEMRRADGPSFAAGSPGYMAHDVIFDPEAYDHHAADVFSLGASLFALVTGKAPALHGGASMPSSSFAYMSKQKKLVEDTAHPERYKALFAPLEAMVERGELSPDGADLIYRMMSKTPALRPSIDEVLADPWLASTVRQVRRHYVPAAAPAI